ncbi:glutaredoxin family protein [bacterium]|nr:glutaredoxin family protein [bacterium]
MKRIKIEIYSKEDCSLCEKAKEKILLYKGSLPVQVDEIDITKDEKLYEKFKYEIPVIFINGKKIFKYKVDTERLNRILKELSEE